MPMALVPALVLAFLWGFAEATVFFIVPDVLLTFLALSNPRIAFDSSFAALAGAIAGGLVMYFAGRRSTAQARAFLFRIPAIKAGLVASVQSQIEGRGLIAILLGPLRGTPYKIYAVEWGAARRSILGFFLISIPARYPRFLLTMLAAAAVRGFVTPLILAILWLAFYAFYFRKFGW